MAEIIQFKPKEDSPKALEAMTSLVSNIDRLSQLHQELLAALKELESRLKLEEEKI